MIGIDDVIGSARAIGATRWLRRWLWYRFWHCWYWCCACCARRRFRSTSLEDRVAGLLAQAEEGSVDEAARTKLVVELGMLRIYPFALMRLREQNHMKKELTFLQKCMGHANDRLSLELARDAFSSRPMGEHDFTDEALGVFYDQIKKGHD